MYTCYLHLHANYGDKNIMETTLSFESLLTEKCISGLKTFALRTTRNEEDAQDLVQETVIHAYKRFSKFDPARGGNKPPQATFFFWLKSMLFNLNRMRLRKRSLELIPLDSVMGSDEEETHPNLLSSDRASNFLSTLTGRERRLANLLIQGRQQNECAEIMRLSEPTISRLVVSLRNSYCEFYGAV